MKRAAIFAAILAVMASCTSKQTPPAKEYLVGCEYFAGWWDGPESKWGGPDKAPADQRVDWRPQYPDRLPLNGLYNSQEVMDKDILSASEYGVDFFSILWYPNEQAEYGVNLINQALDWFVASPHADKMKFMIEITNHKPFIVETDEEWQEMAVMCAGKMKHSSYLRIDGRPVLKIHGGHAFLADLGGDVAEANRVLGNLRRTIAGQGAGDVLIAVGITEDRKVKGTPLAELDIDCAMMYADPTDLPQVEQDYPFGELTAAAQRNMLARTDDIFPFVPYIMCGWNAKPWSDWRANFDLPTREEWKEALMMLKEGLDSKPNLGFPRRDGSLQKAFTIYAWNEFGEGGFLAPTTGTGTMKLEVLKEVFGE